MLKRLAICNDSTQDCNVFLLL